MEQAASLIMVLLKTMNQSTVDIMDRGMRCLTEHLGSVEAEQFIAAIMREKFVSLMTFGQSERCTETPRPRVI